MEDLAKKEPDADIEAVSETILSMTEGLILIVHHPLHPGNLSEINSGFFEVDMGYTTEPISFSTMGY